MPQLILQGYSVPGKTATEMHEALKTKHVRARTNNKTSMKIEIGG